MAAKRRVPLVPDSLQRLELIVNGVPLTMQRVEGGSFMMGATLDQTDRDIYTDKPAHLVFLSPYYIATTEITTQLWRAVMPDKEYIGPRGFPTNPISYVSWFDCQEFVRRLDSITGLPFRLPTETEWEYAARGGDKSQSYRYAGGDIVDSVGWIYSISGNWTHPVARKHPNELELFDMTGNVAEWCQDRYGPYSLSTLPNPCGPDTGSYYVVRGSSYDDVLPNSHISVRRWYTPETSVGYIGLRVALTLPNDPAMQPTPMSPELTKTIKIKGKRVHFDYVPSEQPYYISEEIKASLWKKVIGKESPGKAKDLAIGMSSSDRSLFAEYCSRDCKLPLRNTTSREIQTAEQLNIILPFNTNGGKSKTLKRSIKGEERELSPEQLESMDNRKTQRTRKAVNFFSPLTEMVGLKLDKPDDPVLLQFKNNHANEQPMRLVMAVQ